MDSIKAVLNPIFGGLSKIYILDIIRLDYLLHFVVGGIITLVCIARGYSRLKTFIALFLLAGTKECYDYFFHYQIHWWAYVSDFLISLVYFVIALGAKIAKEKTGGFKNGPPKF